MDRLSSCYFCGVAVDAPLEDYPIVPGSGSPDGSDRLVVTLCPTCRQKLVTIVERVVAADGDPDVGLVAEGPGGEAGEPDDAGIIVEEDDEAGEAVDASDPDRDEAPGADEGDRPQEPEDDAGESPLDDAAVSVLEYNRVMRLLENRELPVERVAFRELATSAYELGPGTVDAVIDAAIDGGLLEEDDEDQLVRPGGPGPDADESGEDTNQSGGDAGP